MAEEPNGNWHKDEQSHGGNVPIPDPTALTAAAVSAAKEELRRDIAASREYILGEIRRVNDVRRRPPDHLRAGLGHVAHLGMDRHRARPAHRDGQLMRFLVSAL
jgi:hypothetical protein